MNDECCILEFLASLANNNGNNISNTSVLTLCLALC